MFSCMGYNKWENKYLLVVAGNINNRIGNIVSKKKWKMLHDNYYNYCRLYDQIFT